MFGVSLQCDRCPDGMELVDFDPRPGRPHPELRPWFRYRSDRRDSVRYDVNNLEDPIVIRYVNARDTERRREFLSRFGGPFGRELSKHRVGSTFGSELSEHRELGGYFSEDIIINAQEWAWKILERAASEDAADAVGAINDHMVTFRQLSPFPQLDRAGVGGRLRLAWHVHNLEALMLYEMSLAAINGARVAACEHCGDVFLTGRSTGRRSTAKYCSDRHRVAAMRKRKEAAKPSDKKKGR